VIKKIGTETVPVWFELEFIRRCKQYLVAACSYLVEIERMTKTHAKTWELEYKSSSGESNDDDESNGQMGKTVDSKEVKCLKDSVKHQDQKWDDLVDENKRLKLELRKSLSSNSRGTKGDIRKDNDWNGEEVNLLDRVSLFCRDYLCPRFKFLSDNWQKYDAKNENTLSYFVGTKMKMNHMNRYEDLWERVFVPTIRLKYQTICCNLNNAIKWIYKGEPLNWEEICCFCI
jgi:hypothetical protein